MSLQHHDDDNLTTIGWVSYIMHLIVAIGAVVPGGQGSILLLLLAFILDLVKRSDSVGSWHESHFNWRIRSVIWAGVLYVLTAPLWLFFLAPGWIAWVMISIWFLYRIILGMINLNRRQAI